ncbi:IMPACT family protein [Natrialbaceae archaeon GCM10025810]|uniref:IMPACT family protein n=1 Tax=Halovalidus salilacus TaxID=3075124 RepID=UPI003618AA4E
MSDGTGPGTERGRGPYRTVAEPAAARFVVQGSEFVGRVRPVDSVEAAEAFVEAVREEYADATHNVPAYRVRADPTGEFLREYSSDDGEPSGSAGKPALNVLTQRDLENVAVVVTRYYGGTNLGVGGLVRAYSRAVKDAVDEAGVIEERPHERLSITVEYDDSGTVRSVLESEGYAFDADYGADVSFDVRVPIAEAEALRDRLRSATSGRVDLE